MNVENFPELLTVHEIAQALKVPVSWVYDRTRKRGPNAFLTSKSGSICASRFRKFLNGSAVSRGKCHCLEGGQSLHFSSTQNRLSGPRMEDEWPETDDSSTAHFSSEVREQKCGSHVGGRMSADERER